MNPNELAPAARIVLEIIKQSPGDEIVGKTKIFKAFYFAHLFYAADSPGYLSEWPIVKMPNGPGIDNFDALLSYLSQQGAIACEPTKVGPYNSVKYIATGKLLPGEPLAAESVEAVRKAVEFVSDKTGAQLSDITHEHSISWNEAEMGHELNIYVDLVSEATHRRLNSEVAELEREVAAVWQQQ